MSWSPLPLPSWKFTRSEHSGGREDLKRAVPQGWRSGPGATAKCRRKNSAWFLQDDRSFNYPSPPKTAAPLELWFKTLATEWEAFLLYIILIFHVLRKPDGLLLQALPRKKKKKNKTQTFYPRICEMMGKEKKKKKSGERVGGGGGLLSHQTAWILMTCLPWAVIST